MQDAIDIPFGDPKAIWVFSISGALIDEDANREDRAGLAPLLGDCGAIDESYLQRIHLTDLGEMSLTEFLSEGYDIPQKELARDAAKLNQLDGDVLIVMAAAFDENTRTFSPDAALTQIAHYLAPAQISSLTPPLTAKSAKPNETPANISPPEDKIIEKKKISDAAMSGRIATLALIVLFLLTWLVVAIS